jgi:hypothetical protein
VGIMIGGPLGPVIWAKTGLGIPTAEAVKKEVGLPA